MEIKNEDKIKLFDILLQGNIQRIMNNHVLRMIVQNLSNKMKQQSLSKKNIVLND